MSNWINANKRLPPESMPVDVWSKLHGRCTDYKLVKLSKNNRFFKPIKAGISCLRDVTHWRTLPKPPRHKEVKKLIIIDGELAIDGLPRMIRWQHDETGRITEAPESPGERWIRIDE